MYCIENSWVTLLLHVRVGASKNWMSALINERFLFPEFLAYMLVALQKVDQEDVDEISELFHKLDVTNNNCLSRDDLKGREEHVRTSLRTSWMPNAPSFVQTSFRGREEEQHHQQRQPT